MDIFNTSILSRYFAKINHNHHFQVDTSNLVQTGFTTGSVSGSELKGTQNINGLSILVPKWLTTAATGGGGGGDWSIVTTSGTDVLISSGDTNTFYQPKFLTTAAPDGHTHSDLYQATGAYLTTAAQVSHDHGSINISATSNSTETAMRFSSNSSGWTVVQPSFITTAAQSGHTHGVGTTASTAGSDLIITSASNSWQLGVPKWLTTAEPAGKTHSDLYIALANSANSVGLNTSTSSTSGVDLKMSLNSSGVTFSVPAWITTYVNTSPGATVFSNSNNINFGLTGSTVTASATGLALAGHTHSDVYEPLGKTHSDLYPPIAGTTAYNTSVLSTKFLVTAAASDHTHGATYTATTAGSELKLSSSSDAYTIGVPKWITTYAAGAGVSWELEGNNTLGTTGSLDNVLYISGGNNITLSGNSNTVVISAGVTDGFIRDYAPMSWTNTSAWVPGIGSWYFAPFNPGGAISGGRINFFVSNTSTAGIMMDVTESYNSSRTGGKNQSYTFSLHAGLYSRGAGANSVRLESFWSGANTYGITHKLNVNRSGAGNSVNATVSASISYLQNIDASGGTAYSQFASNSNFQGTNTSMASDALKSIGVSVRNMLSDQLIIPIGFNTTITEGNYWLGMMLSTSHATGTSSASYAGASALMQSVKAVVGIAQAARGSYRIFGSTASNVSEVPFFGAGVVYTVVSAAPPVYVTTGDVKTFANDIMPYFNFQARGITA